MFVPYPTPHAASRTSDFSLTNKFAKLYLVKCLPMSTSNFFNLFLSRFSLSGDKLSLISCNVKYDIIH